MGETKAADGRVEPDWVVVDVGNTHIKFGMFVGGRIDSVTLVRDLEVRPSAVPDLPKSASFAIASVNPSALDRLMKFGEIANWNLQVVLRSDGVAFQSGVVSTDVHSPETVGVDRVMGCLGALTESPDQTVIVVDRGTATTINVMTNDRCFRGGMITPGRRLLANSLKIGTASLPGINLLDRTIRIGKSTNEALNAGVSAAFLGSIRECIEAAQRDHPNSNVFITGGDASFAHQIFPGFRRVDWLTLKGLYWYATQARSQ